MADPLLTDLVPRFASGSGAPWAADALPFHFSTWHAALAGAFLSYLVLMFTNPVRASLRDGFRCVRRYRKIWTILAGFAFCYAFFQLAVRVFYYFVLPESERPSFEWTFAWSFPRASPRLAEVHSLGDWLLAIRADPRIVIVKESALNAAETLAGIFNNVITTFPFSAIAAIMLLANWEGHHGTLRRALGKRFGKASVPVHGAILLCALAAIVKPILFGPSLPELNRIAPGLLLLRWFSLIDWLSFLFEYLFGVCAQIYLILMVYAWVRGLSFTPAHLLDFAIRRFSFVVKWAALVMLVSALLIDLPRTYALTFHFDDSAFVENIFAYIDWIARPLLALFLTLFATMQITLTFHSESFRKALLDHFAFLRRSWWPLLWFLLIAGLHLFLLNFLHQSIVHGFGEETATAQAWGLFQPLLASFVAAWLLASWVCLFKRCETGRTRAENWIRF